MSAHPSAPPADAPGAGPRLLRAAVFAAVCVVLSALGHVLAACATVPWWSLLGGFLLVLAVAAPLAGRTRSLPFTVGALTMGQLALHTLFGVAQSQLVVSPSADDALIRTAAKLVCGAGGNSLSVADAQRIIVGAGIDPAAAVHAAHTGHGMAEPAGLLPGLPMVLGHLLAALAAGWLLRSGDLALLKLAALSSYDATAAVTEAAPVRALRAALVLVRALLAGLPGAPGTTGPRLVVAGSDDSPPKAAGAIQHTVIRRGPPARHVLAA
ncbi:hypothetical protein [Streptomyces sp. NPDC059176]|uniref:hypothetical protein n=1 Tax=unclassified Streptomyces TaxID=2593676 RepID=UPI0036BF034A